MKIPSNRQWTQDNSGDSRGILGDTVNMAMDKIGKAALSRKAVSILGSRDDGDFGYPISILYFDDQYVVLTSDQIFTFNNPANTLTDLTFDPTVGLNSDAVVFNSLYTVSTDTSIYTWNGGILSGDWVDRSVSLTTGIPHPLAVFGTQCVVGNGNTAKLFTTSYTTSQTLTLPTEFQITTIRVSNNYIYLGTKNLNGGNAKIFVWNGDSSSFDYECEVGSSWVFSMTEYLSTVAAITSQGQLGIVNGTNFEQLDAFPVYYEPHARWQGNTGLLLNGKVFNRGMCTVGNAIYMNIDGDVESGFMPEMHSGIWVYDPEVGLYHRSASSSDEVVRDVALTRTGDVLTTTTAHKLKTGDAVVFDTISGLTGVDNDELYYVKVVSTTEIKLAQSRKALQAENYVTLGGTPNGSDVLVYTENSDYGLTDTTSGAITPTVYAETPAKNLTSEILWGSRFTLPAGTTSYGLFSFTDSYNIGSFTIQRVSSDNIDQSWKEIYNFIDGLQVDTESIVVKMQTTFEPTPLELSGVWLSATQLNNASSKDFSAWSDIEEGAEIVIIDGYGRGHSVHVSSINTSSSTVSLTLDESIGTINQTCTAYYTTFKRVGQALTLDNKLKEKVKAKIDSTSSSWVALKIELRGYNLAVNVMELSNTIQAGSN